MSRHSRNRSMGPGRRTLTVEALEDRTLLDGVVTTVLNPSTGLLQLTGDTADNQLTIALAPDPTNIRVSGNPGSLTTINGSAFADFPLAAVTDIRMTLGSGKDTVTATGFSIPGTLTVLYSNSADLVSLSNFSANTINLSFSNPGSGGSSGGSGSGLGSGNNGGLVGPPVINGLNLTGLKASTLSIVAAPNSNSVSLTGSTIGTARIVSTGGSHDRITVTGSTIGNLQVTADDDTIVVSGTQMAQATITSATGSNAIVLSADTFTSPSSPASLNIAADGVNANIQTLTLADLLFTTPNNSSLSVHVNDAIPAGASAGLSTLDLSRISGVGAATVSVGPNALSVNLDTLTVAGPLNVSVGAHAQSVQLSHLTTLTDVNLTLGNGAQGVTLDSFNVGHDVTIRNGDGDTALTVSNGAVGHTLTVTTGNGSNTIQLDTLSAQNLFVQAGSGTNLIAAHNVTSNAGLIDCGSGPANTYWDQGGNGGFDVIHFSSFLMGSP